MKKLVIILVVLVIVLVGVVAYLLGAGSFKLPSQLSGLVEKVENQISGDENKEASASGVVETPMPTSDNGINVGGNKLVVGINKIDWIAKKITVPTNLTKDIKAEMKVCNLGASCYGDMGSTHWMAEATITNEDLQRGMKWSTNAKEIENGLLQISTKPFANDWPVDTLYSQNVTAGIFVFDFNSVVKTKTVPMPTPTPSPTSNNVISKFFKLGTVNKLNLDIKPTYSGLNTDLLYYIRIIPTKDGQVAGAPTNEVKVKLVPPPDNSQFKLYMPAKIYDIKIKEFTPLLDPDKGVCSHAMILDTNAIIGGELKKAGDRICPAPYKGMGEKAWYEQLWDALASGVSWVSEAYNSLKSAVVKSVGVLACQGSSECEKLLATGLDIGLMAMGVPPTIPNFDQLVNEGFDYMASELTEAAGCPDAVCKELVKQGLKEALEKEKKTDPGCDATEAHNMGIEPICLPKGASAHWDPKATYRDAKVVLEVTRNQVDAPKKTSGVYKILLSSWAKNKQAVGGKIVNIEPYNKTLEIKDPLAGELFQYKNIPLPEMEKGQTMTIPINMVANEYWVPGHKELMGGWTTVTYKDGWPQYQYDDWWLLYYGADLTLNAKVDGCAYYGGVGCVVSEDSKNVTIQMTMNP